MSILENLRYAAVVLVLSGAWLLVLLIPDGYYGGVPGFPLKDASTAIFIAKKLCHDPDISLKWQARLHDGVWFADTLRSYCTRSGRYTGKAVLLVEVPVNGPYPTECIHPLHGSLYCVPH